MQFDIAILFDKCRSYDRVWQYFELHDDIVHLCVVDCLRDVP